jgi:hypothetical protein
MEESRLMGSENTVSPVVINDTFALPGGYMIIISVEGIRERTEERWWAKQDLVWDFAQRQFEKSFPRTDAIRKLNDIEYLIVQASEEGAAAQFKAIDFLKSILTFFLGVSTLSQLNLSIVRSIKDDVIHADPLSQDQIEAITCAALGVSYQAAQASRTHPPNQFQFKLKLDRAYEILVSIDPIWNVYKQAVASYHLRPLVFEDSNAGPCPIDFDEISLNDVLGVDIAILKSAAAAIREGQAEGHSFALHVPIHFRCLRSLSCRSEMARILPLVSDIRRFLAFNILGGPDGAPTGALAEAISALRPHGLGVVMQPSSMNDEVRRWRGLGLSGVAYDFIDEVQTGADVVNRTKEFGAICHGVTTALIGHAISTRSMLLAAWGAGFTHISGAPISDKFPEVRAAVRFSPADIYS